jgi:hypothetical protein
MALACARYRQTGTQRSNATNWATGDNLWYNTIQKDSPLVTKTDSGTPSVSAFTLNANGVWLIVIDWAFSVNSNVYLRGSTTADARAGSSGGGGYGSLTVCREFNYAQQLWVMWQGASATMLQGSDPDLNSISFTFLGAI